MTPEVRTERELDAIADALDANPHVAAVEVAPLPNGRLVVEAVLQPNLDRVPPSVLRTLVEHDLGIADVSPRGSPSHLFVEVS